MCRVNVTATLFTNPFESQILMKFNLKRHKTHIRPNRVQPNESLSCVEQPLASIVYYRSQWVPASVQIMQT